MSLIKLTFASLLLTAAAAVFPIARESFETPRP